MTSKLNANHNPPINTPAPVLPQRTLGSSSNGPLENTDVTRLKTHLFSSSLLLGGVGAVSLAAYQVIPMVAGLLAIPCALIALKAHWQSPPSDKDTGASIQGQNRASHMSFERLIQVYGWNDLLRLKILPPQQFTYKYREGLRGKGIKEVISTYEDTMNQLSRYRSHSSEYHVPQPKECARLWHQETVNMPLSTILETYDLDQLGSYGLVESGELNFIKKLKGIYESIETRLDDKIYDVEKKFDANTQPQKQVYDQECEGIHRAYKSNSAVRELNNFDFSYTKRRQKVQEEQSQKIQSASNRLNNEIFRLSKNGMLDETYLSAKEKERLEKYRRELDQAEFSARQTAAEQVESNDRFSQQRRTELEQKELLARAERDRALEEAKRRFEETAHEQIQCRDRVLKPMTKRVQTAASDCDKRYRAYLKINRT